MNTNKVKPFSCPNCGKKLPVKYLASTREIFTCKNCGTVCKLAKPVNIMAYVIFGFILVAGSGRITTDYFNSPELGLLVAVIASPLAVLISGIYAYNTLEFTRD